MPLSSGFQPLSAITGGVLIGSAAAGLRLFNGDILSAGGIAASVALFPRRDSWVSLLSWKLPFLASFMAVANLLFGAKYKDDRIGIDRSIPVLSSHGYCLAGLLVGFGTCLICGCTSGNGLGQMSRRSFVAVNAFILTAFSTVTFTSPVSSYSWRTSWLRGGQAPTRIEPFGTILALVVSIASVAPRTFLRSYFPWTAANHISDSKIPLTNISGFLFALGLDQSGIVLPSKVYGFLNLRAIAHGRYDPTLAMVLLGGLLSRWLIFRFMGRRSCIKKLSNVRDPVAFTDVSNLTKKEIDVPLVVGAAIFGIGWGIGGICPAAALFQAAVGVDMVIKYWWPGFFAGCYIADWMKPLPVERKEAPATERDIALQIV